MLLTLLKFCKGKDLMIEFRNESAIQAVAIRVQPNSGLLRDRIYKRIVSYSDMEFLVATSEEAFCAVVIQDICFAYGWEVPNYG